MITVLQLWGRASFPILKFDIKLVESADKDLDCYKADEFEREVDVESFVTNSSSFAALI